MAKVTDYKGRQPKPKVPPATKAAVGSAQRVAAMVKADFIGMTGLQQNASRKQGLKAKQAVKAAVAKATPYKNNPAAGTRQVDRPRPQPFMVGDNKSTLLPPTYTTAKKKK